MIDNILFLDFETYYEQGKDAYSLRNMTTPEYILDPRFETILCACAVNDGPTFIVDGPDFAQWIAQFDPKTTATVTYNSLFDNSILAWRYGWVPAQMYDSMNMARALRGHMLKNLKLATVAPALLGRDKGDTLVRVAGMHRSDIIKNGLWTSFCAYAAEDNEQSRDIFKLLIKELPASEHKVMDLVIRTAVQPGFLLDKEVLTDHLREVIAHKEKLLESANIDKKTLMSNPKFQEALEALGVDIEYKTSEATGKQSPCFAKTDQFMEDLQEYPDFRVQALACARLGVKSTLEETRCAKLLAISACGWPGTNQSLMPIPLKYAGAHTHRLSGDWGLNMQNLPRGSKLRKSLVPPIGYSVIVADLAQIEARLVAWLAGAWELLATFSTKDRKGDPYSAFASVVFGRPVDRKRQLPDGSYPDFILGFIGKTGVLGLGYGCGVVKFFKMVITLARLMNINVSSIFDEKLAEKTVYAYRKKYFQIKNLWGTLDAAVRSAWIGVGHVKIGPVDITQGTITGPGMLSMKYGSPGISNTTGDYIYAYGPKHHKMYGAKMLENIIQFLSRIIVMAAALRLNARGYRFVLQSHDELAFIVPDKDVANASKIIYEEMTRPPSWGPDIPLDAEVKAGKSYGDAK